MIQTQDSARLDDVAPRLAQGGRFGALGLAASLEEPLDAVQEVRDLIRVDNGE